MRRRRRDADRRERPGHRRSGIRGAGRGPDLRRPRRRVLAHAAGDLRPLRRAAGGRTRFVTGFGQMGRMFALEHWDVVPDIMAVAKGLISTYLPFGAAIVTDEVAGVFAGKGQLPAPRLHGDRAPGLLRRGPEEHRDHRGGAPGRERRGDGRLPEGAARDPDGRPPDRRGRARPRPDVAPSSSSATVRPRRPSRRTSASTPGSGRSSGAAACSWGPTDGVIVLGHAPHHHPQRRGRDRPRHRLDPVGARGRAGDHQQHLTGRRGGVPRSLPGVDRMGPQPHTSRLPCSSFLAELSMKQTIASGSRPTRPATSRTSATRSYTSWADFGERLRTISPHMLADPRASGGSMFRIYRDVRFSKGQEPVQDERRRPLPARGGT